MGRQGKLYTPEDSTRRLNCRGAKRGLMTSFPTRLLFGAVLGALALLCAAPAARAQKMQNVVDNMVTVFRDFQSDGGSASAIPPAVLQLSRRVESSGA